MFHVFYQNIPLNIDQIAFSVGSFSVRWYALSYLIGFLVVYLVLMWRIKKGELKIDAQIYNLQFTPRWDKPEAKICNKNFLPQAYPRDKFQISNLVLDYLLVSFFSALIGGRVGYVLFYNASYFLNHPLAIISPYDQGGAMVGIFGMSYHGALLGIIVGSWTFLKRKKIDFLAWADFVVPAISLGYFFGRLGNFFNGELYGRVTNSFWGMHFMNDPGKLRHPSQLYEALLEGLLLFGILWSLRNGKMPKGFLLGFYFIGYGFFRIAAEQFREPDFQIGFLLGHFTLGQMLSLSMILGGTIILFFNRARENKQ